MADQSVHEAAKERRDMGFAAVELTKNMRTFQARLAPVSASLGEQLGKCAALFERISSEIEGSRPIGPVELRTCARLFERIAIKTWELGEVLGELEDPAGEKARHPVALAMLLQKAGIKIGVLSDWITDVTRVLDLRLS